ncbi:MAG: ABC transporter ATP-binding protein [Gammaproteobacteria bacterium]
MASITAENLCLDYPIYEASRSFRTKLFARHVGGVIAEGKNGGVPTIRALSDINLDLKDGDRLGFVGHNGAGKTTLLKVLGGFYKPTEGSIRITGHSYSLVTMGIGIDPDDTGYENIMTCGLYLGMSPEEIREKTDEIAEFTELGDFLHLPVKTYSTGMVVRLTFAITTATKPEIMLMDEGIGAGDARFARKAKQRVDDMITSCSIMVVASHSTSLIQELCNEAALLSHGTIVARGAVDDILKQYEEMNSAAS